MIKISRATYKKVITDEELINKINPKNKKLVGRFLKNFETKRSPASVKVYRSNFNIFFCWNVENNDNKFFIDIKKIEFMDFFDYASEVLCWSPARYSQMWSSLSSLSSFIENILDEDYPDFRNQIKKIEKVPKAVTRKKTILSDEQVNGLLSYLSNDVNSPQEACLLALLASSGVRISEAFEFTIDVIDVNNTAYDDLFLETTEEIKTKGRGKKGKYIHKYILKALFLPYYTAWMKKRKEIMEQTKQDHNFLFIRTDGTPACVATSRSWMRKWEKYLTEIEPTNTTHTRVPFYPHCMRHWLCTYLAKRDIPQELIVELFGWSSSEMYKIYNDTSLKEKEWKELKNLK